MLISQTHIAKLSLSLPLPLSPSLPLKQVKARDKSSHTEVKAVLDFLSAIPAEQHGRLPATVTGEGELLVGSGEQEHDIGESSVSE